MGKLESGVADMGRIRASRLPAVSAAVMVLGCGGAAYAADLGNMVTKAPPAPPGSASCTSIEDFFTTACQLSWYGVRFYGTVDVGGSYQTNGAPFAKFSGAGVNYFLGKANNGAKLLFCAQWAERIEHWRSGQGAARRRMVFHRPAGGRVQPLLTAARRWRPLGVGRERRSSWPAERRRRFEFAGQVLQ